MADKQSFTQYIDPQFSRYDPALARAMTEWLYADRSNPLWNDPDKWASGPKVVIVKRNISFAALPANGGNTTSNFNITGGKNAIVFSRAASITLDGVSIEQLPNTLGGYVEVEERRADGFLVTEQQPINNSFGTVPGWPVTTPAPEFWRGNVERRFTVTNNYNAIVTVDLSFQVAFLDTGR